MIGENIRGFRHLFRVVGNCEIRDILIQYREYGFQLGKVVKLSNKHEAALFLFGNPFYSHGKSNVLREFIKTMRKDDVDKVSQLFEKYDHRFSFIKNGDFKDETDTNILELTLLPSDFNESYELFCKENKKMFTQFYSKYCLDKNNENCYQMYILSNGSKNFFQWGVNVWLNHRVSLYTLKRIMRWNENYSQLVKGLTKGTITAYTSKDAIEQLKEEIRNLTKEKRIADTINSFNTVQKKLMRSYEFSENDKKALSLFARLSETKRINFIRKASTITDINELLRQLHFVTSTHFKWNKSDFIDYLNNVDNLHYSLIYEKDDILLIEPKDFDTIKRLAKMTNWCISKNKTYWNQYTNSDENAITQYMLFDFSRKEDDDLSIVGFTVKKNKGITHAHDYTNNNLMRESGIKIPNGILSYLSQIKRDNSIFSILNKSGIDISSILKFDTPNYPWNPKDALKYLNRFVKDIVILKNDNNKLVVSVTDTNIASFLGKAYQDNVRKEFWGYQHILFFDFSKEPFDSSKMQYAMIYYGYDSVDKCEGVYNERSERVDIDFDDILDELNLPYTTIRRTDDKDLRFSQAFFSFKINEIKAYLKDDENLLQKVIMKHLVGKSDLLRLLIKSINTYASFDYLELYYSLVPSLYNLFSINDLRDLTDKLINTASRTLLQGDMSWDILTDEQEKSFYDFSLNNQPKICSISALIALNKILAQEQKNNTEAYSVILMQIVSAFLDIGTTKGSFVASIVNQCIATLNFAEGYEIHQTSMRTVIYYILRHKNYQNYEDLISVIPKDSRAYIYMFDLLKECSPRTSTTNNSWITCDNLTEDMLIPANEDSTRIRVHY